MGSNLDWIFRVGAWALVLIGAGVLVWALFRDRAHGRRRCPKCWYSLEGATADGEGRYSCPECGRSGLTGRALGRTRRRWKGVVVAAALFLLAPLMYQFPQARDHGWMYYLPDRLVIEALPIGGIDGVFGDELRRRLGDMPWARMQYEATLSPASRVALLRRAARGNVLARPVGPRWRESYGRLLKEQQWRLYGTLTAIGVMDGTGVPATPELERAVAALGEIPYVLTVRTRDKWPVGIEPHFEFEVQQWWPAALDAVNVDWTARSSSGSSHGGRGSFPLKIKETGRVEVNLKIEVLQESYSNQAREKRVMGTERRSVTYTTVDTMDEAMVPVSSAAVDAALAAGIAVTSNGDYVQVDPKGAWVSGCDDVGFGLLVELAHDGKVLMTAHSRWLGAKPSSWAFGNVDTEGSWQDLIKLIGDGTGGGWTLHMKTDESWALAVPTATRYWKGDITVPVQIGITNRFGQSVTTRRTTPAKP